MKELISVAVLIAGIWGGSSVIQKINSEVRKQALAKAVEGLPPLTTFKKSAVKRSKRIPDE